MLNKIIRISMKSHVSETRYNEVQEEYNRELGKRIETDIRNRIDPGISFAGHQRARAVKVQLTDTGKIRIRSDQPEKSVLKPDRTEKEGREVLDREDTVDDLFTPSSGVPQVVESGGQVRVAFRTVRDTDLFGRAQEKQDADIKRIVDNTVQMHTVDMMDLGVRNVERRYPSEQIGTEDLLGGDE